MKEALGDKGALLLWAELAKDPPCPSGLKDT